MKAARLIAVAVIVILAAPTTAYASFPGISGGKFEVTCKPRAIPDQAIDPIVSPGVTPSAHIHTFFGNRAVTSTVTPAQLMASTATTCVLPQDTAAYWVPVACNGPCVDANGQPTEQAPVNVIAPVKVFAYYFGTPGVAVSRFPSGLKLVGGNSHATTPDTTKQTIAFACGNGGGHSSPVRYYPYDCTAANGVKNTDGVVAIVKFPYCWDGSGVAPSDVTYGSTSTGTCPAGTQTLGQVQMHVHYGLDATGYQTGSTLNFSSGPYWTLHADWMDGWQQAKLDSLVSGCLDVFHDCGFLTTSNPGPGG